MSDFEYSTKKLRLINNFFKYWKSKIHYHIPYPLPKIGQPEE